MSSAALMGAIANRLQANLSLPSIRVGVQDTGNPDARFSSSKWYIAVHPGSWGPFKPVDYGLYETIGVKVTVSLLGPEYPKDLWGVKLLGTGADAIEFMCRRVIAQVHQNIDLMQEAHDLMAGTAYNRFVVSSQLRLVGADFPPQTKYPDWWGVTPQKPEYNRPMGISTTLTFDGAERYQKIADLEPVEQ